MYLIISTNGQDRHRIALSDARTLVGSAIDCDIIVAGAPARWFEAKRAGGGALEVHLFDEQTGAPRPVAGRMGRTMLRHGRIEATIRSGLTQLVRRWLRIPPNIERLPPRPVLRRLAIYLPLAVLATLLGAMLLMPSQPEAQPEILGRAGTRLRAEDTVAARTDSVMQVRDSLQRMGFGSRVTVVRKADALVVSGTLDPEEAGTVRNFLDVESRRTELRVVDRILTPVALPQLSIRAFGSAPDFIVLADGRRVEPGDSLKEGWRLRSVGRDGLILERQGVTARMAFAGGRQ